MVKIQKLDELHPTIPFSEFDFYSEYQASFHSSELGGIHLAIPWSSLVDSLKLPPQKRKGRKSFFTHQGKLALMFLKSYTGFSDADLIENLNSNIHYQIFCGVRIHPKAPLTNFKIVSQIRCELASALDINDFQSKLATYWKPYLNNLNVCMTDATCYESYIRYPTDVKLLWESVYWLHEKMVILYKDADLYKPRTKYNDIAKAYLSYSKKRKKPRKKSTIMIRRLLKLLEKLVGLMNSILDSKSSVLMLSNRFRDRYSTIKGILVQQKELYEGKKVESRIVSIDKPYIRPIVRGKEKKSVEFGAKVNALQIDGINFIEHFSFEAFHEGVRLPECISRQQKFTDQKVCQLGADAIYATNNNRTFCRENNIYTNFVRKGRAGKDETQASALRSIISKERATRLEGSFGTEKNSYGLSKIKARTEKTEILWIFFGIHTANAVRMINKMRDLLVQNSA